MNELLFLIVLIIISYLTGSTPTSIIIGRIAKNIDIREHGSGNAGGADRGAIKTAL